MWSCKRESMYRASHINLSYITLSERLSPRVLQSVNYFKILLSSHFVNWSLRMSWLKIKTQSGQIPSKGWNVFVEIHFWPKKHFCIATWVRPALIHSNLILFLLRGIFVSVALAQSHRSDTSFIQKNVSALFVYFLMCLFLSTIAVLYTVDLNTSVCWSNLYCISA